MLPLTRRHWLIGTGASAALAGVAVAALKLTEAQAAPDTRFVRLDGVQVRTGDLLGQVALVNFWATSCTTCVGEMPKLIQLHRDYAARGLRTLAVAMSYDRPEHLGNFVRSRQLPFEVAFDADGAAARSWGDVQLTPTTFLLGRDGRIVRRIVGEPDFARLRQDIDQAMRA